MHSEEKEREREREWHESPAILVIYNIMTEINLCELQLNFCPISYFRVRTFFLIEAKHLISYYIIHGKCTFDFSSNSFVVVRRAKSSEKYSIFCIFDSNFLQ